MFIKLLLLRFLLNEIDTNTFLPKKLILENKENTLIFLLTPDVFQKRGLEYKIIKDRETLTDWRENDFDNNFIWLKKLEHGEYKLQMRMAMQRHNVTEYPFKIKPLWYQTKSFGFLRGFLLGLLIVGIFLFSNQRTEINKAKKEKERINNELKAIRSQLNPHFVFNALNSIQSLINNQKVSMANYYLTEFSTLLRESLLSNNKEFVPFSTELKTLETYIKLERLRFRFDYRCSVDAHLNTHSLEMPYLLLQPLVENAIKHGVSSLYDKGSIRLSFDAMNSDLVVQLIDNGNGFNIGKNHKRYGLKLTNERIRLLNESNPEQPVTMTIDSSSEGTKVQLVFKNWI